MAEETESLLIKPISLRQFELYTLSLERGPNFGKRKPNPACRGFGVIGEIACADHAGGHFENVHMTQAKG
jgi:hypothetical protein